MEYHDKITLVSLNDSLLQFLSPRSLDINDIVVYQVRNILEKQGIKDILPIDCGSLFLNKQHNITEFLKNNLSVAEIKATQQVSIDASRHGIAKYFISEKLKGYYGIKEMDSLVRITDAIKNSQNVGVLLSCVANDIMSLSCVDPIRYMIAEIPFMDKAVLKRAKIFLENKKIRNQIVDGLRINIEQILSINDNSKICTFGIYRPQVLPNDFDFLFKEINVRIQEHTKEYEQSYIDINDIKSRPIDFHPNRNGYEVIANRVANTLHQRFNSNEIPTNLNTKPFLYQTLGLDGAISDMNLYIESNKKYVDDLITYLIAQYNYTPKETSKILGAILSTVPTEAQNMREVYTKSKVLIK